MTLVHHDIKSYDFDLIFHEKIPYLALYNICSAPKSYYIALFLYDRYSVP